MNYLKRNNTKEVKKVTQFVQDFLLEAIFSGDPSLNKILEDKNELEELKKYMIPYWASREEYEICMLIKNTLSEIKKKNVEKFKIPN